MNVIVCVRQTPDTESAIKIAADGRTINTDGLKYVLGPYDEYSHEAAVQLVEKNGGEVTAISFGPERVKETLRNCLAIGASRAVHIHDEDTSHDDALAIATALAAAIKPMSYDLIFTSNKGTDSDRGLVGAMLAERLGLPYVGLVSELELEDGGKALMCGRDVEGGQREKIKVTLPAVICAQKGLREPRYASLMNIMQAKKKPLETKTAAELGVDTAGAVKLEVEKMEYPPQRPPGRLVEGGSVDEKVKELVRLLKEEAKVL
ncbi:electron transfer flavoprotein subunit beta/FixA family protein [bacterium CPR1]|nr:electron transfer flavoprotein subunit beta/FixA family protein [bacterium CPR1]